MGRVGLSWAEQPGLWVLLGEGRDRDLYDVLGARETVGVSFLDWRVEAWDETMDGRIGEWVVYSQELCSGKPKRIKASPFLQYNQRFCTIASVANLPYLFFWGSFKLSSDA